MMGRWVGWREEEGEAGGGSKIVRNWLEYEKPPKVATRTKRHPVNHTTRSRRRSVNNGNSSRSCPPNWWPL